MTNPQTSLFPPRPIEDLFEEIEILTQEIQDLYCLDQLPWILGYSGGKDSTCILQLIWNAIAALPPEKRTKRIDVITTDTLVENPIVAAWVRSSLKLIDKAAQEQNLPFKSHLLQPEVEDTFWVGLVGKGYPPPRGKFRWCTNRLKIQPSNNFIRNITRQYGQTILILGIRKAESSSRAARMKEWEKHRVRDRLSPNMRLPNSLVYSPIEDWRNDEVWLYLNQWENPWGCSNKDLFSMYRGASPDNECPLVVDTTTPSCGNSRFGCWVCTLVSQDKSLAAMIRNDEEKEWLQPLLDLRADLDVDKNRKNRDFRRRQGTVQLYERNLDGEISIEPIPGPFTKKAREDWLRKLLITEQKVRLNAPPGMEDITLLTHEEISEIRRIWLEEFHEFDDRVPQIYQEVTGEEFDDPRPGANDSLLGVDEWSTLEDICADEMHLELMSRLLDTERQYFTKSRRSGIFNDLEKCFEISSRSKEEAIANAHLKRELTEAAAQGNVAAIKQLTLGEKPTSPDTKPTETTETASSWGNLKFPSQNT